MTVCLLHIRISKSRLMLQAVGYIYVIAGGFRDLLYVLIKWTPIFLPTNIRT